MGRLYEVDMRLRPTGKSGSLVLPLAEFRRYFAGSGCQLWERQALARALVVRGDAVFANEVRAAIRAAMLGLAWCPQLVDEVRAMRQRLEATASPRSLKRGPGGLTDVEFAVQLLQLKYGREHPEVLEPNVWDALDALSASGVLPASDAATLPRRGYSFLRPGGSQAADRHRPGDDGNPGRGRRSGETGPPARFCQPRGVPECVPADDGQRHALPATPQSPRESGFESSHHAPS